MQFPIPGLAVAFFSASVVSLLLVGLTLRLARRSGLLDFPGPRQSHDRPTPTGGGVGIIASMVIVGIVLQHLSGFAVTSWLAVLPGMAVLSFMGWIDDRKPLSSLVRLLVQLMVAGTLVLWIASTGWNPGVAWLLVAILVVVGVMNAYNFMDGSNGMAGFQALFSGLLLVIIFLRAGAVDLSIAAVLLAGSCAGFLPLNFPRARIFMGDSGSVPIGFCLIALMLLGFVRGVIGIPEAILLLLLFLVDSSLTLLTRAFRGERWYTAHKQHIYQRLIVHGWSHSRVLLLYQAINIVLVVPALMLARMYPDLAWMIAGLMFLLTSTGWYLASLRLGVRN